MHRGGRGPNLFNRFDEEPVTTNGVYGFTVVRHLQMEKACAAERALARCKCVCVPPPRVLCRRRPFYTDLIAVNPRVKHFIAPPVPCIRDPPYTPKANKRYAHSISFAAYYA